MIQKLVSLNQYQESLKPYYTLYQSSALTSTR